MKGTHDWLSLVVGLTLASCVPAAISSLGLLWLFRTMGLKVAEAKDEQHSTALILVCLSFWATMLYIAAWVKYG
jgi:hypothetical protein